MVCCDNSCCCAVTVVVCSVATASHLATSGHIWQPTPQQLPSQHASNYRHSHTSWLRAAPGRVGGACCAGIKRHSLPWLRWHYPTPRSGERGGGAGRKGWGRRLVCGPRSSQQVTWLHSAHSFAPQPLADRAPAHQYTQDTTHNTPPPSPPIRPAFLQAQFWRPTEFLQLDSRKIPNAPLDFTTGPIWNTDTSPPFFFKSSTLFLHVQGTSFGTSA